MPPAAGCASWLVLNAALDEAEAWDAGGPYYAVSLGLAFTLGAALRETPPPLAQGLLLAAGQLGALLVTAEEHTFVLLGVVMFCVLGLVFAAAAASGAWVRARLRA